MVVKELRQSLRTRTFGIVMLGLHALLTILMVMIGGSENASEVGGLLDGLVTLILCIMLPLSGFSAVAHEIKAGTLDTLSLTGLSAIRIITGKWLSIASQCLLIALSILPYVVARYVFGGIDILGELEVLYYKWLAGVTISSVIIALSTQRQFWLRALAVGLPLLMGGCGVFSWMVASRIGGGPSSYFLSFSGLPSTLAMTGLAAWAVFFFLTLAATRIAPAGDALSIIKRPVHLALMLLLAGLAWVPSMRSGIVTTASFVLSLIMMDALTERVNDVPSVYAAFYRRRWLGRLALGFLAPGWVYGFFYTVILVVVAVCSIGVAGGREAAQMALVGACTVWMTAVIIQLAPSLRRAQDLLTPYIVTSMFMGAMSGMFSMLLRPGLHSGATPWYACGLPSLVGLGYASAAAADQAAFLRLGTLISLVWPFTLLILALLKWRRGGEARREGWILAHPEKGGAA